MFSLIGLKRRLYLQILSEALKGQPEEIRQKNKTRGAVVKELKACAGFENVRLPDAWASGLGFTV